MRKSLLLLISILLMIPAAHGQTVNYRAADSIGLGRRIAHKSIQVGTGVVVTVGLTQILKAAVSEQRPDGSGNNAFPSQHTSLSFAGASIIANELYRHSPWWVLGAQALATGVGFQRVMSESHYPGDVLAGAVLGMGSMQFGYWVGDLFYPSQRRHLPQADNQQAGSLSMVTEAVIPLCHPSESVHFRTGLGTRLTMTLPFSECFSLQASAHLQTMPLTEHKRYSDMLNSLGLTVGAEFRRQLSRRWAAHARVGAGAMRNLKVHSQGISRGSFRADLGVGADCRLTSALSVGACLGWQLGTYSHACSALNIGMVTKACF